MAVVVFLWNVEIEGLWVQALRIMHSVAVDYMKGGLKTRPLRLCSKVSKAYEFSFMSLRFFIVLGFWAFFDTLLYPSYDIPTVYVSYYPSYPLLSIGF